MESLLSGAGVTIAAAVIMLAAIAMFRSTGPENAAIELQTAAADVCGDIGNVAVAAVPCTLNVTCSEQNIDIRVTSDYVIAVNQQGTEFARPLPVRVYPGRYRSTGEVCWNSTLELRQYLNATYGVPGTKESPLSADNGSLTVALLDQAGRDMALHPAYMDQFRQVTIEKLFLYVDNASKGIAEVEPYVFVYA
jgi:hypothetical protein